MHTERTTKPTTLLSGGLLSLSCLTFSAAQEPSSNLKEPVDEPPITQPAGAIQPPVLATDIASLPPIPNEPTDVNSQPDYLSPLKECRREYYQDNVLFLRRESKENEIELNFLFFTRTSSQAPEVGLNEVVLTIPKSEVQRVNEILLSLKERGFNLQEPTSSTKGKEGAAPTESSNPQLKINEVKEESYLGKIALKVVYWTEALSLTLMAVVGSFKLFQIWRARNSRNKAIKAHEADIIKRREKENAEDSQETTSPDLNAAAQEQVLDSANTLSRQAPKLEYTIRGAGQPTVTISLPSGGLMFAESGAMLRYDSRIQMNTLSGKVLGMSQAPIGFLKRFLAGESLFIQSYTNDTAAPLSLTLAPSKVGEMLHIDLSDYPEGLIADQGAFFAATSRVQLDLINKGGIKGIFSGLGMFQQKFSGKGDLFLFSAGSLERFEIQEGQSFKIDSDALFLWEPSVNVSLTRQSLGEAAVSGEGLFTGTIAGHGAVWLASRGSGDDASRNKVGGILSKAEWIFRMLNT